MTQSPRCSRPLGLKVQAASQPKSGDLTEDPEKPFRRYGSKFGAKYSLSQPMQWLADAPRVRFRSAEDRKLDELVELTVVNERISGKPAHEVRRRLEYLKLRRRNWEAIYHYITETDAVATLELIEEANRKVGPDFVDIFLDLPFSPSRSPQEHMVCSGSPPPIKPHTDGHIMHRFITTTQHAHTNRMHAQWHVGHSFSPDTHCKGALGYSRWPPLLRPAQGTHACCLAPIPTHAR